MASPSRAWERAGHILSVGEDPFVRVWDSATGLCGKTLEGAGGLRSVAVAPDGTWIASSNWYMTIFLWDAATGELVRTLEGHSAEVRCVAFSPDGRRLATASLDGTVKVWALGPKDEPEQPPAPGAARPGREAPADGGPAGAQPERP